MGEGPVNRLAATGVCALGGLAGIVGISVGKGVDVVQYETVKPVIFSVERALEFASCYGPGIMVVAAVGGLLLDKYRMR